METKIENSAHSFTEGATFSEENPFTGKENEIFQTVFKPFEIQEALSELIALHNREMHDDTITLKEWQNALKKGKNALKKFNEKFEI